jgi:hypothetical protein
MSLTMTEVIIPSVPNATNEGRSPFLPTDNVEMLNDVGQAIMFYLLKIVKNLQQYIDLLIRIVMFIEN